jgi:hypothetical protein
MITVNDILSRFQELKTRFNEFYTAITGEVNADANLDGLTSSSKTADYNKWMFVFSAMSMVMDGLWEDRQTVITTKLDNGIPGTDRWLQLELFKFQYGDALSWDSTNGKYYYAVPDETKQIIKRCAVISSGGITSIKVAKLDNGGNPVPLTSDELSAFVTFVKQIQWAGSGVLPPVSFESDKLDAPMTVYYNGTRSLADIKDIVEAAWTQYVDNLPFNAEYSVNKHGDFVEAASIDIREVEMGDVRARADIGSFSDVTRVYTPVSGYMVRDSSIDFDDMITYMPV